MSGGILDYLTWTDTEKAEAERCREAERKRHAEEAKQEAEAAAWAADLRKRCAEADVLATKYLANELQRVRVKLKPKHKSDFNQFREFCIREGWPYLPALPQGVFEFLVTEGKSYEHVAKLANSISVFHLAYGRWEDPTADSLVKAFLLQCKEEEKPMKPHRKEIET
jgi:hypothetical protein